jgi:hypothetical protein
MAKSNSDQATVEQRREHWRRIVGRWQASGLSQAAFCRRQDIPVWQLAWWRKRLKGQAENSASLFVPVTIAPTAASAAELELMLQGGRILRFRAEVEPTTLAGIVAALEKLPVVAAESSTC